PAAVTRDRYVVAVREREQLPSVADRDAVDAVTEVAGVDHSRDDDHGARDRSAGAEVPEHGAVPRRDAVQHAVVRAEEDPTAPDRGRGIDVRAGADRP